MPMLRKVRSLTTGAWIKCVWFECDKPGVELHKAVLHDHGDIPCDDRRSAHVHYIFCSERHRQYFLNSHKDMGKLPAGYGNVH